MLTHVVVEWTRGLGKDIWMNIDISLAPCGVSAGGMGACKTLTKEWLPPVTDIFLSVFSSLSPSECSTVLSFMMGDQSESLLFFMTFKLLRKTRSGYKLCSFEAKNTN